MALKHFDDIVKTIPELVDNQGLVEIRQVVDHLSGLGYGQWLEFSPSVIRGFDYYDGLIFEVFDNHQANNRALFGGGRYNGLAEIFGNKVFPAVGCAPGDETIRLFLESWGLIDQIKQLLKEDIYYLPLLSKDLTADVAKLAYHLRAQGQKVQTGLEAQKINKALDLANKKQVPWVIILGEDEKAKGVYKLKNMETGQEETVEW